MKLQSKGNVTSSRAELLIKRRRKANSTGETWEVVRARGHLDEVQALRSADNADFDATRPEQPLVLLEGPVLGGGAFSRVSIATGRFFAGRRARPVPRSKPGSAGARFLPFAANGHDSLHGTPFGLGSLQEAHAFLSSHEAHRCFVAIK